MKMSTKSLILLLLFVAIAPLRSSAYLFGGPGAPNAATPAVFQNLSGSQAGQTVYGLSKLKSYFQAFGYIDPSHPTGFSDLYDDTLENAVRLYQQNFHIEDTGMLNDETLQQIMTPRCGVPDIINGSNTMASGAGVAHYSFFEGRPQWPRDKGTLTYAFLPQNKGETSDERKHVFASAFARWSKVIPLTFVATEDYDVADIKIGFYAGDAGDGITPFDGPGGQLFHAHPPTDGHLSLDGREIWVQGGDIEKAAPLAMDLESTLLHAIGHLIGLNHSADKSAVMYPSLKPRTRKLDLAVDDVQGAQLLYGTNSGSAPLGVRWWRSLLGVAMVVLFLIF